MSGTSTAAKSAPTVQPINTRPGLTLAALPPALGLLADLAGTWVGTGFNVISLPDFDSHAPSTGPSAFRLKLNSTIETLEFTPIGGSVPNRGALTAFGATTGQPDIALNGLRYLQRVSDLVTNEALHIEPGFWLSVPPTTVLPPQPAATLARLSTIPHGDSLMAQGGGFGVAGGPLIAAANTLPTKDGKVLGPPYTTPFQDPPLPQNFKLPFVQNPNLALQQAILGQDITSTVGADPLHHFDQHNDPDPSQSERPESSRDRHQYPVPEWRDYQHSVRRSECQCDEAGCDLLD